MKFVLTVAFALVVNAVISAKSNVAVDDVPPRANINLTDTITPDPYTSSDPTSQATLVLRADLFTADGGDIPYYAVLVAEREFMERPDSGAWNGIDWPEIPDWRNATAANGTTSTYQTTPARWQPFADGSDSISYTIGTGECDSCNYCNGPLKENVEYAVKDTEIVRFRTLKRLPVLLISSILGSILLTGVAAVFVSVLDFDQLRTSGFPWKKKGIRSSAALAQNFSLIEFRKHANFLLGTEGRISNEFHLLGTLSSNLIRLSLNGQRIENRVKNRYLNVLPFDESRVRLPTIDDDPSTDYINANYIAGCGEQVPGYIAAQGPNRDTCRDFYRMVINEGTEVIVMLTDLCENGVELCFCYFPAKECSLRFGDIEVSCMAEEKRDFFVERRLAIVSDLIPDIEGNSRTVTHLQFEGWPVLKCPENSGHVLEFCEYASRIPRKRALLVHGSLGIGRTGAFIAIDILLRKVKNNEKISAFGTVLQMRKQRVNMVQTLAQYVLVYECISQAVDNFSKRKK